MDTSIQKKNRAIEFKDYNNFSESDENDSYLDYFNRGQAYLKVRMYDEAFNDFKSGKYRVLISSNITARGIDIQQVGTVINFDIPKCVNSYLHRIGRSGRWGRKGLAINFVTEYDVQQLKRIETHYNIDIKEFPTGE